VTRRLPGVLARIAVAASLTAYVLWKSDPGAIGSTLRVADWRLVLGAVVLVLVDRALMAYRWLVLLRPVSADSRLPFWGVLRVFFISTFVGTFLPASIGGDAVRAIGLSRHNVHLADAAASVLLDRLLGTVGILLLAAAAALYGPPDVPGVVLWSAVSLGVVGTAALAAAVFSDSVAALAGRLVRRISAQRVRTGLGRLLEAIRRYRWWTRALANVLAGSIGVQLLRVAQAWLLGVALGISLGPAAYLVYIPLILLVMLLPITVNGIGTSQAAFVWLFGLSGVAAADAFALSVLFVALGIVGNLPGAVLFAFGGMRKGDRSLPLERGELRLH
jgi:uncharacterized protein (TIRG00374 family)